MEKIKQIVKELLSKSRITIPPVAVEKIAKKEKIKVKFSPLEGNISGLLYRKEGKAVIGVNGMHPDVRQRFTLAHELGHYMLGHTGDFFVDRAVLFRDTKSQEGRDQHEIDANRFAAELLMPPDMVRRELKNISTEFDEDEIIEKLASIFIVSTQAMAIRLQTLGLLHYE